jgi:serine O-acetyltransferase
MLSDLYRDAIELTRASARGEVSIGPLLQVVLLSDPFVVLALTRAREAARRFHVPLVNRVLRLITVGVYGVEIGKDVSLGHGVYFVHTLGTVLGGDARIGDRVRFMGNNTVGTAKDNGYPVIERDVVVGCGARILGPVRIGAGAVIGANAVVLRDVPEGAVAYGVPAVVSRGAACEAAVARPYGELS